MGPRCFMKKDSDPPLCGVHNVPLIRHWSSDHLETFRLGDFEFFVCPASGYIVKEADTQD